MPTKHLNKKPIEDALAKTKITPSVIQEKTEGQVSSQVSAEALDDTMSNDEFNKAMAALNNIWSVCPAGLPKDLSAKHDDYLFGEKK
ncbi:MAG TPA: hypothetical protein ACFYEK_16725 [Candidatus Wunengus sp. YC60]|uniref:hypothetical protein n=1 Tax=Candidatus Wunengus sp. YC60 TaxID=3367697 RepID=UPI0040253329